MKNFKILFSKIKNIVKRPLLNKHQSIMSRKAYHTEEIPIDKVPIPYGESILSMGRYSLK